MTRRLVGPLVLILLLVMGLAVGVVLGVRGLAAGNAALIDAAEQEAAERADDRTLAARRDAVLASANTKLRDLLTESADRETALGVTITELVERLQSVELVLTEVRAAAAAAATAVRQNSELTAQANELTAQANELRRVQADLVAEVSRLRRQLADDAVVVPQPPGDPGGLCRAIPVLCD